MMFQSFFRSALLTSLFAFTLLGAALAQKTKVEKVDNSCKGMAYNQRTRVAVSKFVVSTPSADGKFGDNLAAMLSNTLVESNCFRVLESSKNLDDLTKEMELNNKGLIQEGIGAETGQMLGAQLLVSGEITEFSENESGGGGGGLLGAKGLGAVIGGVGVVKAHVGFILKITNPTTREILTSRSFERKVTKVGAIGGGMLAGIPMGGLGFKSKAMADAVEEAILESSQWLVEEKAMLLEAVGGSKPVAASPAFGRGNCPLLQTGQSPTVMVIIPEVHITQRIPDPAGETEIIKKLINAGFKVLDPSVYKAIRESQQLNAALKDANAASTLGAQFGADIIIIGEAFSESAGAATGNLRACRARVEARAVRTVNAQIVAADGKHAGGTDVTELTAAKVALRNAGSLMADYFLEQLCQASFNGGSGGASPSLAAGGSNSEISLANVSFSSLAKIETTLKGINGVQSAKKSMKGNTGTIAVVHTCSLDDIASALAEGKAGIKVEITGFADNKIDGVIK